MEVEVIRRGVDPTRVAGSGLQVWELVNEVTDLRDTMIAYTIIPVGASEGPHVRTTDEFIFYLEGESVVTVENGPEYTLKPGEMVRIPPGISHSHANRGQVPVIQVFFRSDRTKPA